MALGAAGNPTKLLTLTCAPLAEPDPVKALELVHRAWRTLRLIIAREFVKPPSRRWLMTSTRQRPLRSAVSAGGAASGSSVKPATLPYFAVVERHKSGRPHLHILLRCGFVPQQWISRQMRRLAGSPICDIRQVHGTKQAVAYVAKYVGKAPQRFGNHRAYWYTKNWDQGAAATEIPEPRQSSWFSVRPRRLYETLQAISLTRPSIEITPDGWFRELHDRRLGVTVWYEVAGPPELRGWQDDSP